MANYKINGDWRFRYALSGGQAAFPTLTQPLNFTWNLTDFTAIKLSGYTMSYTRKSDGQDIVMFNAVWSYSSGYQLPLQISAEQSVSEDFYWWLLSATDTQGDHSAGYTVMFDTRGGEPTPPDLVGVTELPALPTEVSRSGYYLAGWSYTDGLWSRAREGDIIASDTVLYAWWKSQITISVASETGLFEYTAREVEQVHRVVATVDGDERTLTLYTEAGLSYLITYTAMTLEGQRLLGWAETVGGPVVITMGDNAYTARGDVTLYEVYATDHEIDPPVTIDLYANTAEAERVNKSSFLTALKTLKGALRSDCSLLSPSIVVYDTAVPHYNYARIPDFAGAPNTPRFYFIDAITNVGRNLWRLDMRVDVLMTWRIYIGALDALVERQEFTTNPRLYDSEAVTSQVPIVTQIRASSSPFVGLSDDTPHNNVVVTITAPNR